jgi:hypothetical protein
MLPLRLLHQDADPIYPDAPVRHNANKFSHSKSTRTSTCIPHPSGSILTTEQNLSARSSTGHVPRPAFLVPHLPLL